MSAKRSKSGVIAGAFLKEELAAKPQLLRSARYVMQALSGGEESASAWRILGEDEATIKKVIDCVGSALRQAVAEANRPIEKHEREDIQQVIDLARRLQQAIRSSSLPKDRFTLVLHQFLSADGLPNAPIDFYWDRQCHGKGYGFGYPVAVTQVLDWAAEMAQIHLDELPLRSVLRRTGERRCPERC